MIKNILPYFLLLLSFLSCKNESSNINGYYLNQNKPEIYQFDNNQLFIYNFKDSIIKNASIKLTHNRIKINHTDFLFNHNNKELTIFDPKEIIPPLKLHKFKYRNVDIKNLDNSEWKLLKKEQDTTNVSRFIRIDSDKGIRYFYKEKESVHTNKSIFRPYEGKMFDKFHAFSHIYFSTIIYSSKDSLIVLYTNSPNTSFSKRFFKKINTNPHNNQLIGKWRQTDYKSVRNSIYKNTFIKKIRRFHKENSIEEKKLIDFKNIEFAKNGSIIRKFFMKNNDSTILKSKFSYNKYTNYIFINDLNTPSKDVFTEEQQSFQVIKLTNDSLIMKLNEPNLLLKYKKVR